MGHLPGQRHNRNFEFVFPDIGLSMVPPYNGPLCEKGRNQYKIRDKT